MKEREQQLQQNQKKIPQLVGFYLVETDRVVDIGLNILAGAVGQLLCYLFHFISIFFYFDSYSFYFLFFSFFKFPDHISDSTLNSDEIRLRFFSDFAG